MKISQCHPFVQSFLATQGITDANAEITLYACMVLAMPEIQKWIRERRITIAQVLDITIQARSALCNLGVQALIRGKCIAIAQVLGITSDASLALCDLGVQALLRGGA